MSIFEIGLYLVLAAYLLMAFKVGYKMATVMGDVIRAKRSDLVGARFSDMSVASLYMVGGLITMSLGWPLLYLQQYCYFWLAKNCMWIGETTKDGVLLHDIRAVGFNKRGFPALPGSDGVVECFYVTRDVNSKRLRYWVCYGSIPTVTKEVQVADCHTFKQLLDKRRLGMFPDTLFSWMIYQGPSDGTRS